MVKQKRRGTKQDLGVMLRRWKRRKLRENEENSVFRTILVTKKFLSGGYIKTKKTGNFSGSQEILRFSDYFGDEK